MTSIFVTPHKGEDGIPAANAVQDSLASPSGPKSPALWTTAPPPSMESTLSQMDAILLNGKVLSFTTLPQLTAAVWEEPAFYHDWLAARGNTDIKVGHWQETPDIATGSSSGSSSSTPSSSTENVSGITFHGETYDQKRVVSFKSPRVISSVTTPDKDPTKVWVTVQEVQYYRRDVQEEDRVIVMTHVKQSNIPFGDTFTVHWRWVATDVPAARQVAVQVGFSVNFAGNVLLADQLRKQQQEFSAMRHLELFRAMKQAMANRQLPLSLKEHPWHGLANVLRVFFPFFAPEKRVTTVPRMIARVLEQLCLIELMPAPSEEATASTLKEDFERLVSTRDALGALCEKEKVWVLSTLTMEDGPERAATSLPDESSSPSSSHEDSLPPFLRPLAHVIVKLKVMDPFDQSKSIKPVLSEMDNTVILLPYMDTKLDKMELILSKTIFHCTVHDVWEFFISSSSLGGVRWYKDWLVKSGRSQVDVGDWTAVHPVRDEYSGEDFTHVRTVISRFQRSDYNKSADTSAAQVPATVTQQQFLRWEKDQSALVWSVTTTVAGIAFSDCWKVHVRWVVSQVEEDAIQVKVGYELEIVQPFMMESVLRSKAFDETKNRQIDLLCFFRPALFADMERKHRKHPVVETVQSTVTDAADRVRRWVKFYPENMLRDDLVWEPVFKDFRKKLKLLQLTLGRTGSAVETEAVQEEARHVFIELDQIRSALENIVASLGNADGSTDTLKEASFTNEKTPSSQ